MLKNTQTEGQLGNFLIKVSNIFDKVDGEIEKYTVTTSTGMRPCTRSIFIFEKY